MIQMALSKSYLSRPVTDAGWLFSQAILRSKGSIEKISLAQRHTLLILVRQQRRAVQRPFDADGGIVPGDAAFALGGVKIRRFIQELSRVTQGDETMSEACRDPELVTVFC
jgi:hypothetical protein